MDEGEVLRLGEVKLQYTLNYIILESHCLKEVDKFLAEEGQRFLGVIFFVQSWQVDQKHSLARLA